MNFNIKTIGRLLTSLVIVLLMSCDTEYDIPQSQSCGKYNGHQLFVGPKGGCYYINSNNNKTYVDRNYCNCY